MQLTIFDIIEEIKNPDDIITEKATLLLEALNDGKKSKDKYLPHYYFQEKGNIVLIAINKDKDVLCNVIDGKTGNTPNNFSACWRTIQHLKQELSKC